MRSRYSITVRVKKQCFLSTVACQKEQLGPYYGVSHWGGGGVGGTNSGEIGP